MSGGDPSIRALEHEGRDSQAGVAREGAPEDKQEEGQQEGEVVTRVRR